VVPLSLPRISNRCSGKELKKHSNKGREARHVSSLQVVVPVPVVLPPLSLVDAFLKRDLWEKIRLQNK
jgi:hypothetical protein